MKGHRKREKSLEIVVYLYRQIVEVEHVCIKKPSIFWYEKMLFIAS